MTRKHRDIAVSAEIGLQEVFASREAKRGFGVLAILAVGAAISIYVATRSQEAINSFLVSFMMSYETGEWLLGAIQDLKLQIGDIKVDLLARIWLLTAFLVTLMVTFRDAKELFESQRRLTSKDPINEEAGNNIKKFLDIMSRLDGVQRLTHILVILAMLILLVPDSRVLKFLIYFQIIMVFVIVWYDFNLRRAYRLMPNAYAADVFDDLQDYEKESLAIIEHELSKSQITFLLIDIPILVGVFITAFLKLALSDNDVNFATGVATGAVALHVVAGNLMTLSLNGLIVKKKNEPRLQP